MNGEIYGGAGLGGQQRLRRREAQRDVHHRTFRRQCLAQVLSLSGVSAAPLTATFLASLASPRPSSSMGLVIVATVSALTDRTMAQISPDHPEHGPASLHDQRGIGGDTVVSIRTRLILISGDIGGTDEELYIKIPQWPVVRLI